MQSEQRCTEQWRVRFRLKSISTSALPARSAESLRTEGYQSQTAASSRAISGAIPAPKRKNLPLSRENLALFPVAICRSRQTEADLSQPSDFGDFVSASGPTPHLCEVALATPMARPDLSERACLLTVPFLEQPSGLYLSSPMKKKGAGGGWGPAPFAALPRGKGMLREGWRSEARPSYVNCSLRQ